MPVTQYLCKVKRFTVITPTVFEIAFEPDLPLSFEAGQFVSIVVPGAGPNGRDLRRAYSIASCPDTFPIELCVKLVEDGPGTNYLYKLRPGDTFRCYAPYGDFTFEPRPGRHACFISTGTGLAPFRSMLRSKHFASQAPASAMCLFGVRHEEELLYVEEMEAAEWEGSKLRWVPCVSRPKERTGWKGFQGRVTDYLRTLGGDYPWLETDYYLCGGSAMIDEVKQILMAKGVQKDAIHQEIYYREPKPDLAAPASG